MGEPNERELSGPDGGNPLGFLCALGTLHTLTNAAPHAGVRLSWRQRGTRWTPVLQAALDLADMGGLAILVCNALKEPDACPPKQWDDSHNIPAAAYRDYAASVRDRSHESLSRRAVDWVSALGCEVVQDDKGFVDDTAFRTMSGQGHQHFLKQMRLLQEAVTPQHIIEAWTDWQYRDEKLNLRLDPMEDRRHALRWKSPDKDTIKTVWGANCLAVQGIPLHPAFVSNGRLETTGFHGHRADDTVWTWPIWSGFLNLDSVRSVLALSAIQQDDVDRAALVRMGIVEAFRSNRIAVGRFRAFTSAEPV